jgi:hypothetical protein
MSIFGKSSIGDVSTDEVRKQVVQLCRQGQVVSAWHFAIRSWQNADCKYGAENAYTAELLTIVAEVAKDLKKYQLAAALYDRALETQERLLGRGQPQVEQSRSALADTKAHSKK